MVDWIPGVSQIKSYIQLLAGDLDGAKRTQTNFSRQCPVVSQVRSAIEYASGDTAAAKETLTQGLQLLDGIPGVGHAKGLAHYACGDNEGGNNAMKAASRTVGNIGKLMCSGLLYFKHKNCYGLVDNVTHLFAVNIQTCIFVFY